QEAIEQDAFATRIVGNEPAVLREEDGRLAAQETGGQTVEERRVLVGVNQPDSLLTKPARQPPDRPEVPPGPAAQHLDGKPFRKKFVSECPCLIEARKHKAIVAA